MRKMTIMNRIKRSVSNRKKQDFFLTSDFSTFGSKSAVAAALRALTSSGFLIRISLGVYAKTEWNKYTNSRVASMPIGMLAPMALERMGYEIKLGKAAREYADALVTQIPQKNIYEIGNQRITRKFSLYGQTVYYEKNGKVLKQDKV